MINETLRGDVVCERGKEGQTKRQGMRGEGDKDRIEGQQKPKGQARETKSHGGMR